MTEEAVELQISKEAMDIFGNDRAFTKGINSTLASHTSEQIYHIIETHGEVIIHLTEGTDTNYSLDSNQFVFRKIISWQPLVRCKDCIHNDTKRIGGGYYCTRYGMWGNDGSSFFCGDGVPKEKTDDN